jgi:tape measure domain-containing protein
MPVMNEEVGVKVKIGADTAGLEHATRSLSTFGDTFKAIIASQAVNQLVQGFKQLSTMAIGGAGEYEQYRVAFETMLGSADKARKMLQDMSNFARSTPFTLPEVVESSKQLLAFGIAQERVLPTMKMLGDVAAGVGVPVGRIAYAFGQVKVAGKLMASELLQFTNAGVPLIEYLAVVMKKPQTEIRNMVEAGQIGFDKVETAFALMTQSGGRFDNMMAKQSTTFNGLMSNIKDSFGQMLRAAVGISATGDIIENGIFDRIKKGAEAVMPALQRFSEQIGPIMANAMSKASQAVYDFVTIWKDPALTSQEVPTNFDRFVQTLRKVWDVIYGALAPSLKALWSTFKDDLLPSLKQLVPYMDDFAKIIGGTLIAALWLAINSTRMWFQVVATGINIFFDIKNAIGATVDFAARMLNALKDTTVGVWQNIYTNGVAIWNGIRNLVITVWNDIYNATLVVWNGIYNYVIKPILGLAAIEIKVLAAIIKYHWDWIYSVTMFVWHGIYNNAVAPVITWIEDRLRQMSAIASAIWTWVGNQASMVGAWISARYNEVAGFLSAVWQRIGSYANSIWNWIRGIAGDVANWITGRYNELVGWFAGMWQRLADTSRGPANSIKSIFSGVMEDVKNIIRGTVSWATDKMNGMIGAVNSVADKVPGAPKIPKIPGFSTGGFTGQGGGSEIAGFVHRGEYVVPRSQVDQSTGMPKSMGVTTYNIQNVVLQGAEATAEFFKIQDRNGYRASNGLAVRR